MLYIIFLKVESDRSFENDFGNILSEIRDLVVSKKVDSFPQTEVTKNLTWFEPITRLQSFFLVLNVLFLHFLACLVGNKRMEH